MKTIGFIGGYDKSDLIIYVSKVLRMLKFKVLVIDTTLIQKMRYTIPSINPTKSYITDFEDIDFAIGFKDWEDIEKYLAVNLDYDNNDDNKTNLMYDYVLIDIDSEEKFRSFEAINNDKNFFVTAFDMYSLKKGLSVFSDLQNPIELTKIFFSYELSKEDDEYLNFISLDYKVNWKKDFFIYFQIFNTDNIVMQENQRLQKIRFRNLSINFKDSITNIIHEIDNTHGTGEIKKIMRD